jgi:hypothetical protein
MKLHIEVRRRVTGAAYQVAVRSGLRTGGGRILWAKDAHPKGVRKVLDQAARVRTKLLKATTATKEVRG